MVVDTKVVVYQVNTPAGFTQGFDAEAIDLMLRLSMIKKVREKEYDHVVVHYYELA